MEIIHYSRVFRSRIDTVRAVREKITHVQMKDIKSGLTKRTGTQKSTRKWPRGHLCQSSPGSVASTAEWTDQVLLMEWMKLAS